MQDEGGVEEDQQAWTDAPGATCAALCGSCWWLLARPPLICGCAFSLRASHWRLWCTPPGCTYAWASQNVAPPRMRHHTDAVPKATAVGFGSEKSAWGQGKVPGVRAGCSLAACVPCLANPGLVWHPV